MNSFDGEKKTYTLGNVVFSLRNCDAAFEEEIAQLIPVCMQVPRSEICEIEMMGIKDLRSVINNVLYRHAGCIWVDAACLCSPNGKVVLISGQSGSGKSTTSMALALRYGWRVLSEDLTLIDPLASEIIAFGSPFSLKKGTSELLEQFLGSAPKPILLGEWLSTQHVTLKTNVRADFDVAVHFGAVACDDCLQCTPISMNEYIRSILPYSNVSRNKEAPDKFFQYLANADCFRMLGGSLGERVRKLFEVCEID